MKRFSNILFVAGSADDDAVAFGQAVTLAKNNQARVTVVGLVEAIGERYAISATAVVLQDVIVEQRREQLQKLVQSVSADGLEIDSKILVGKAFVEVIREVLCNERDLVIKSVESAQSVGQHLFGGTDMKLLRKCPCPVWLIQSTQQKGYREILVALDYDPENLENDPLNRQILEMASSLALSEFSELHVVHAWRLEHEDTLRSPRFGLTSAEVDQMVLEEEHRRKVWLTKLVQNCCAVQGKETADYLTPQLHLIKGHARNVVPECAREMGAELVVMGTLGRTGIPGFVIGNTAEGILNKIDCSVLAVKPAGFISPVTIDVGK